MSGKAVAPSPLKLRPIVHPAPCRPAGDGSWRLDALCAQTDGDAFFPTVGSSYTSAKRVCLRCAARGPCLEDALVEEQGVTPVGMRGGLTPKERTNPAAVAAARRALELEAAGA